ncbi:nucleotidyltransferase domain-containing protein [Candidatus Woesearchaeota archaeon]|nr:nucleotidyltransferase domain-containing protein [Candidatus Woesearchaeota archaeon]
MKFQKSILKVYEYLLINLGRSIIAEEIVKGAKVGRSAGFDAINELVKLGIANEELSGKQKKIYLKPEKYSLSFKIFLDSFKFKNLDEEIKLAVKLFIDNIKNINNVKSILLFGSAANSKDFNDIDLLVIHDNDLNKEKILIIRKKIENLSDKILNIHFSNNLDIDKFTNSLCIYGFDYCTDFFSKDKSRDSFLEATDWLNSYKRNKTGFDNIQINLAFAYCYHAGLYPKTKNEAKSLLLNKYPHINEKNIKEVMKKVGKEIFR